MNDGVRHSSGECQHLESDAQWSCLYGNNFPLGRRPVRPKTRASSVDVSVRIAGLPEPDHGATVVGKTLGDRVGSTVGLPVGNTVGDSVVGKTWGDKVGSTVGFSVGNLVGSMVGVTVG